MNASMQTFLAVILGALLASLGGFAATQVGIWIDRSRRAQSAALLCGEILAAVGTLLRLAEDAAVRDTFLDPIPVRLLRAARREIDLYDRNRELLFSLENADLRARLHGFIIRLSIPLDRLADNHARYLELCSIGPNALLQAEGLRTEMEAIFRYLVQSRNLIPALLELLQPLARTRFDSYSHIDRDGNTIDKPP
jgi:hypothetical protein